MFAYASGSSLSEAIILQRFERAKNPGSRLSGATGLRSAQTEERWLRVVLGCCQAWVDRPHGVLIQSKNRANSTVAIAQVTNITGRPERSQMRSVMGARVLALCATVMTLAVACRWACHCRRSPHPAPAPTTVVRC